MTQSDKNYQEIDLLKIVSSISKYISNFLRKHLLPVSILFIVGIVLGFLVNSKFKKYESRVLVSPSYGTVDYLYNQVDVINSKIKIKDSAYLKSIGFNTPISKITIEPVNSIYQFVQENEKNYDLVKLFAEDGDINKVAEDEKTSKNYKVHELKIHTKSPNLVDQNIDKLIVFLNKNDHFNRVKEVANKNNELKIISNNQTIAQINAVLAKFDKNISDNKSSNLVYFNDNNQLSDILGTKNSLIKENEFLELQKINSENFIKKEAQFLNIESESKSIFYIVIFPAVLIFLYLSIKQLLKK